MLKDFVSTTKLQTDLIKQIEAEMGLTLEDLISIGRNATLTEIANRLGGYDELWPVAKKLYALAFLTVEVKPSAALILIETSALVVGLLRESGHLPMEIPEAKEDTRHDLG
jgi:hypothetical protein